jgi:hypothetical protein
MKFVRPQQPHRKSEGVGHPAWGGYPGRTAGPSTALRFGRDDKSEGGAFRWHSLARGGGRVLKDDGVR